METLLTSMSDYLVRQSGQIALWALVIAGGCLLLCKVSAHWRYWLWVLVIAKCLLPPVLTIPLALLPPEPIPTENSFSPAVSNVIGSDAIFPFSMGNNAFRSDYSPPLPTTPYAENEVKTASMGERFNALTLEQKLAVVWLLGVFIYLAIAAGKAVHLSFWLRRNRCVLTETLQKEYDQLLSQCQVKKGPGIWLVPGIPQPFVWGLVRGSIYLPVHFVTDRSKAHRGEVIMHEIMHVVRFDALVNFLQIMAQGLYFFHPLVWLANKRIRREREKCCDEMVLAYKKSSPQQYGSALLDSFINASSSSKSASSLAIAGPAKNIEGRIIAIMKPGKIFYCRPSGIAIMTILLLAVLMIPTVLVLTAYTDNMNRLESSGLADEQLNQQATKHPDVAHIAAEDLRAQGDPDKQYFLIGPKKDAEVPAEGYRLLIVLPASSGGVGFLPFVKRNFKNSLSSEYLVAELVAKKWNEEQQETWPTNITNITTKGRFSTEVFIDSVIKDVKQRHRIDPRYVFILGWMQGGPASYAYSLDEVNPSRGAIVMASDFEPKHLPQLEEAGGYPYFILHSVEDQVVAIQAALRARRELSQHGAKVELVTYPGGHSLVYNGIYPDLRNGIAYLEHAVDPVANEYVEQTARKLSIASEELLLLPPDVGVQVIDNQWRQLSAQDKLKRLDDFWAFRHPQLKEYLHLGARDVDEEVKLRALTYFSYMSFDSTLLAGWLTDPDEYLRWYEENKEKSPEEIIRQGCRGWVDRIRTAEGEGKQELANQFYSYVKDGREERWTFTWDAFKNSDLRKAAQEEGLIDALTLWLKNGVGGDRLPFDETVSVAREILEDLELSHEHIVEHLLPLVEGSESARVRREAELLLLRGDFSTEFILDRLSQNFYEPDEIRRPWYYSRELARRKEPWVIPTMIGIIDSDNSNFTRDILNRFGMSPLTGVPYSSFHDGAFWRRWWEKNKSQYSNEVQELVIPDLPKTDNWAKHTPYSEELETIEGRLKWLLKWYEEGDQENTSYMARELGESGDPRVVPTLIGLMEADDIYVTRAEFGLSELAGVKFNPRAHDGAWWRKWWEENKGRYPEDVRKLEIPKLTPKQPAVDPLADVADIAAEDLRAGGDADKRYFLMGPKVGAVEPAEGYRLLVVLPGGDGGDGFHAFVRRIFKHTVEGNYLAVQPVAKFWDDDQEVVWPTKTNPYPAMKFSTEEFIEGVVKDAKQKYKIDPRYVFTLGWSSSGPALYAASLQKEKSITGSFVAMSVFHPDAYPPLENAVGHPYYILHSPDDWIRIDFAEAARDQLREHGANTTLQTYPGGHGWVSDPYGNIRKGIGWLEKAVEGGVGVEFKISNE
ncbi:MAG: hypothetical protein GY869_23290 [Planctomycetes bacterium]|nr:hypothetical protein [Planctomycetota bacterium]